MKRHGNLILLILRIFGTVLGIGFLIFQVFSSFRGFTWPVFTSRIIINIFLALVFSVLAVVFQMTAWNIVLEGIHQKISLLDVFTGFNLSFVARLIPGTVWGYLTRGDWLKREHGIAYAMTNLASIVETFGYLAANLFIVMQGFLSVDSISNSIIFVIIFLIGTWAFLNLLISWKPARRLFRLDQNQILQFPLPQWIMVFSLSLGMWYCYGISLLVFSNTIKFQFSFIHVLEISAVYALAWLLGFIVPFLPTGLGLREYSLTILLIAQFGFIKADAAVLAIGFRITVSLAEFIWIAFGVANKALLTLGKKIIL